MFWNRRRTAPAATPVASPRSPLILSLEPRMLFDGAVAATVADNAASEPTDTAGQQAAHQDDGSTDLAATPTSGTADQRQEVVFVDSNLRDYQQLVAGLPPGVEVVVLDGSRDGLQQMADYLDGRSGIDAIHVFGHGSLAQAHLGTALLNNDTLSNYAGALARIGQSLTAEGDLLLYGCHLAQGEAGRAFIESIARLTQADVAASEDATGAAAQGGDWLLEFAAGTVEAEQAFDERLAGYQHLLSTTLSPGDIAVLGLNVDDPYPEQRWAFVVLRDISVGTVIHFTDAGFDASGNQFNFNTLNEGHMTWVVDTPIGAGKAFVVTNNPLGVAVIKDMSGVERDGVIGSLGGSSFGFSPVGDQVLVYQGTAETTIGATFIYGLNTGQSTTNYVTGFWMTSPPSSWVQSLSYLPTGLVNGTTAIALTHSAATGSGYFGYDNMRYAGITSGTRDQLLAAIGNPANWSGDDFVAYDFSTIGNFTVITNAAPTITGAVAGQAVNDNATLSPFSTVTITDTDGDAVTVTVALDAQAKGVFTSASLSASGFTSNGNGTYSLASSTAAAATTAIRALVFDPTNDRVAPGSTETTTFTVTVNDGASNGINSITTVVSTSINDAPSLAHANDIAAYTKGGSAAVVSPSLNISDPDSETFQGATVTLDDFRTGDVLNVGNASGFTTSYDNSTGVLTLTGSGNVNALRTALRSVTYSSNASDPTFGGTDNNRQISFTVTDAQGATSGAVTAQVAVSIPNEAPALSNLNGDIVTWSGEGNTVRLDTGSNVSLADAELDALNGGNGNWSGASLVIQRNGTAVSSDVLGFDTSGALFTVSGSNLQSGGQTFATFTNTGGVLTITFTSSGTTATTALVNDVAQRITYRNDTPAGDASMRLTLNDGAGASATANVTVASDFIYVTKTTDTATIDASNGTSFSEAVAIAAADSTGTQTIVFASNLAGQVLNLNTVSINESLTFDMDQASGLILTGGTITLGAGTTQTFTHGAGDTATISSVIAGSGALTKAGAGNLTLSGAGNTFTGATTISAGTLTVSGGDAISTNSSVSVAAGATLALAGNESIGNLSGAGSVTLGSFSLTSTQTADTTFSGAISGTGGVAFSQLGAATYSTTLSGTNSYTGNTTLANYGWLKLNGDASMADTNAVRVNGNSVLTLLSDQTIGSLASSSASANIELGSYTLTAGGNNTNTMVNGVISGSGSLVKLGSGTMTLSGSNTFGGTTTVSAGTLSITGDGNLGSGAVNLAGGTLNISGATTIDNAIVLTGNSSIGNYNAVTLSGAISGPYSLTKTGSGTLTLSGSNSYGATIVNGGTLSVASDANLGSGSVTLGSGTTFQVTGATTIDNAIDLTGNATVSTTANATLSGVISGAFTLTKAGASTLALSGTNTYGATTVSAGTLSVASDSNLGSGTLTLASGSTLSVTSAGTLDNAIALSGNATVDTAADTTLSGVISGSNNLTKTGSAVLTLTGSNTYSGSTSINAGTLSVASDANLGAGALNLANGTTLQITGTTTIDNALALTGLVTVNAGAAATLSGTISGTGSLTKTGTSNLTLSGSNTNSGATTVAAGTLVVDGSTNSATTVASGATLAGSGTLGGDVSVQSGGTLSPGNGGAGTLTVNGNLTLALSSTLALDIDGATAGTGYDRVVVNGNVDVSGATLAVTHGYAAGNGDSYTVIVNDAADAVTGTFSGVTEGSKFNAAGNGTELTTSYVGGNGNDLTLTAPIAPTVTSVSSSTANSTYKIGDVITVTVRFDSAVNVTGTPTLTLETGVTDRVLNYVSGSGTDTLSFSYTVQDGDSSADLDYVSNSALSLNGGTIRDGANQNAILTLPTPGAAGSLGANKALVVDGVRPAATSITLSDTALRIGETATVTVTFNEAVLGLDIADFSVANGTLGGLSSSDGGLTWTATFTPGANVSDATNLVTLDNAGVMDQAGNIGSGTTDSVNYAIDTQRPSSTIVVTDTVLKAGQTTTVTITFSEAVTGLTTADFTVANGSLSNLATSDNITWTATLTPSNNVTDATNLVTLDNTGVLDLAGNAGTGTTDSNNYAIDTQRPTATIVVTDTALKAGQSTAVTLTFSEAVTGLTTADFNVANGALSNLGSNDGGITWTATLTPSANVTDPTNLITLDNTGYTDAAGNTGTGTTDSNNYAIDSRAPAVTSVGVPANGTYVAGNTLDFTVNFDEAVTVDTTGGTPRLAITLDTGGTVYANYVSGSGGTALVFRLTVASGQQDSNGVAVGASLDANGATLRDAAGNEAGAVLNGVNSTVGVLVDAAAPLVTGIALEGTSPTRDSTLGFTVTFSEAVIGVGLDDFALVTTGSARGTLQSVVQLDARTYRVTVVAASGQGTLGLSLVAAGSGIADAAGNPLLASHSIPGYQLGSLDDGDPEFRANPTPSLPPAGPPMPLQPGVPDVPPSSTTSPLAPPALFESPTLGSGLPPVGNIFLTHNALAPSFIAQVFQSSGSNGAGSSFSGLGGGTGGLSGSSSLASLFGAPRSIPGEQAPLFDSPAWRRESASLTSAAGFGAPTLGQQLDDLQQRERQHLNALAQALGQFPGIPG